MTPVFVVLSSFFMLAAALKHSISTGLAHFRLTTSRCHIDHRMNMSKKGGSRNRINQRMNMDKGVDGIGGEAVDYAEIAAKRKMAVDTPVDYAETVAKRKMALTLAYVGSNYFGLQMDPNTIDLYPTVERELERALYEIGCIAESNKRALNKIGWSRSSRTDKGVHCARLVISVKLEVKLGWLKGRELRVPDVVDQLNARLPSDIRVLSCCKINQGFRAKEACSWREYEYLLPTSMLYSDLADREDTKERFLTCLKAMEGTQSFHNFHRLSVKALKGRQVESDDVLETEADEDDEGIAAGEVPVPAEAIAAAVPASASTDCVRRSLHEVWEPRLRDRTETTRGIIFACEVVDNEGLDSRVPFIRIRIRGQSFLLHQIRLMVGCAVLVARDTLPMSALDMALLSPYFINLPLAPAEGLVLINAGFDRNSNGQTVAIFQPPIAGVIYTPGVVEQTEEVTNEAPANATLYLMTPKEFHDSERFKNESIYAQMALDWAGEDKRNGLPLVTSWLEHAEKYRASTDVRTQWDEVVETFRAQEKAEEATRRQKETQRLQKNLVAFREAFPAENEDGSGSGGAAEGTEKDADGGKKRKQQPLPHKKLLPNSISTAIINRFRCMPGDAVLNCQRALATAIIEGKIPIHSSTEEICDYMLANGGFEYFSSNEPYRHPYID